jgi:hypothetical protein
MKNAFIIPFMFTLIFYSTLSFSSDQTSNLSEVKNEITTEGKKIINDTKVKIEDIKESVKDVAETVKEIKNDGIQKINDLKSKAETAIKDGKELAAEIRPKALEIKKFLVNDTKDAISSAIKERIELEKKEVKELTTTLGHGYLASTISLFAATLIGPQVIMVCKTKPSAIIYAGTAAFYIVSEMMNVKILKASQLAEIEVVSNVKYDENKNIADNIKDNIDMDKSYKENIASTKSKIDDQISYFKTYKKTLDSYFRALKKKARNAKIASAGFLAASAAAIAEEMNMFGGGGSCVLPTSSIENKNVLKNTLVFSKKFDEHYKWLIDQARNERDKWAYYYEWEAYKFGADRSMTWEEFSRLKSLPLIGESSLTLILSNMINSIQSQLVTTAFAGVNPSEKITVIPELKNKKMADWYGDLDKLGIVGGAATSLIAYMSGWQMGFLQKTIASGTSRSLLFGAQSAIAFTAGSMFDTAAKGFIEKMAKVDKLVDYFGRYAKTGLDLLVPSDSFSKKFQEIADHVGVHSDKLITEMTIREAIEYIEEIKETANEKLSDLNFNFLNEYSDKLKTKASEIIPKIEALKSTTFIDWLFPLAHASTIDPNCIQKKNCPPLNFPKIKNEKLSGFNQYLNLFEGYYMYSMDEKPERAEVYSRKIFRKKPLIAKFRNATFSKLVHKNYNDLLNKSVQSELQGFEDFFLKLPPSKKEELQNQFSPFHELELDLSNQSLELAKLENPLNKTNQISHSFDNPGNTKSKMPKKGNSQTLTKYQFIDSSIHPKESNLFDIIHFHYALFYRNYFNSDEHIESAENP